MVRRAIHNLNLLQRAISRIYLTVKLGAVGGWGGVGGTLLGKLHIRGFDT